ncbi:hypothetical protein HYC85_016890 [Camellia sinensis]|uniref:Uncharacterized protein n=1 Tax=Camellia sinensis TaxID=4442 RepID=A0A7J7H0W9_CAMSI|nr:hypothetical protein HYC85_016890 [Camellia sinensis]
METLKIKQENIVVIDEDIPGGGGGGGLIEEEEEETVKVVEVKEEAVVLVDDDCVSGEGVVLVGGGVGVVLFSASLDVESSPSQDQKINAAPGPMSPDLSSENYILWEKLLEDELIYENGSAQVEAELVQHQSKIVLQLENLIAKPPDWACYVKDLVEQLSCLESK